MSEPETVKATPVANDDEKGVVRYSIRDRQILLNTAIVRKFFCSDADDMGAYAFMGFCRAHQLDPFAREAYLSYRDGKPVIQVAYTTFMKRAERHPKYKGFKAGLILQKDSADTADIETVPGVVPLPLVAVQGEFIVPGWTLLGGWALVYRKDRTNDPIVATVALVDYIATKGTGEPMFLWKGKKATMIRKTAIAHGFQNAFPDEVGDMRIREEFDDEGKPGDTSIIEERPSEPLQAALPAHLEPLFDILEWNKAARAVFVAQHKGDTADEQTARLKALVDALPPKTPKVEDAVIVSGPQTALGAPAPGEGGPTTGAVTESAPPAKVPEPKATGLLDF